MAISYAKFKRTFGDLGITEWVKFNWLSNGGIARSVYNKVVETGYNPLAYVNDELYNRITKSINIWDEETQLGYWNAENGQFVASSTQICSKNKTYLFGNTQYYLLRPSTNCIVRILYYDANDNFILQINNVNGVFTTPVNCSYIQFNLEGDYGTTYNHDICINISNPYINSQYFPYFEGEKFLVLVGSVDLGTLNWIQATYGNKPGYYSQGLQSKAKAKALCLSEKYTFQSNDNTFNTNNIDNEITINDYKNVKVKSTNSPSGYLFFELATPVLINL